jgi:RNA polymerase sigma-70 factor (ECF subfamily)
LEPNALARFEAEMVPHLDAAYTLARYLLGNDADAEDVVQEAFLRAFKYFRGYRGGDARAWLLTIVRNTSRGWLRRERAAAQMVEFDEEIHSEAVEQEQPEAELFRAVDRERVREALDGLPAEFREVVVLRELQGLSYQEIGEICEIPAGTVMSRLSRARKRLEHLLGTGKGGRT